MDTEEWDTVGWDTDVDTVWDTEDTEDIMDKFNNPVTYFFSHSVNVFFCIICF